MVFFYCFWLRRLTYTTLLYLYCCKHRLLLLLSMISKRLKTIERSLNCRYTHSEHISIFQSIIKCYTLFSFSVNFSVNLPRHVYKLLRNVSEKNRNRVWSGVLRRLKKLLIWKKINYSGNARKKILEKVLFWIFRESNSLIFITKPQNVLKETQQSGSENRFLASKKVIDS